jgi:hypothetical protein
MALQIIQLFSLLFAFFFAAFTNDDYTKFLNKKTTTIGPGSQPKAVIDEQGVVKMVYGLEDNLYYIESSDKGKSFTKPSFVARLPEGLMLGMGRGPQIACLGRYTVITAVNEKGNIYSWMLAKKSKKWVGPSRINDLDTVAKEGFVAIAKGKGNTLYAVWNDLRSGNNQIYGSLSKDGGLTWNKNKLIYASPDTTICECCKVSMVYDNKSKMYVMWRNQIDGFRDMYLLSIEEGMNKISSPIKLGKGNWKLKGCPMDGGNLYSDENGNIVTVWRREGDIYMCEPGKEEVKLGTGKTPAVIKNKQSTQVLWSDHNEILAFSTALKDKSLLGNGRYPNIVSRDGLSLAFWETENRDIVITALYAK